jgi:hypothetical protein
MVREFDKWNHRPIFFENEAEHAVTVNSERYVAMVHNFLTPQLARFPVNENTFSARRGNKPHCENFNDAVNALFPGRVISRNGDIPWPPRSRFNGLRLFYGVPKNKCLRPIHPEQSQPSTYSERDCSNTCQYAARGHAKLPGPTSRMHKFKWRTFGGRNIQIFFFILYTKWLLLYFPFIPDRLIKK